LRGDGEAYFLACCRFIELNPVRAGIVRHPRDYRWSSWKHHAAGASDPLLAEHALYRALGDAPEERQNSYRALTGRRAAAAGTAADCARGRRGGQAVNRL
jgi:hypothetical protein